MEGEVQSSKRSTHDLKYYSRIDLNTLMKKDLFYF